MSDIAGTTRDAVDTEVIHGMDTPYVFIDTARPAPQEQDSKEELERYSIIRTVSAVERADVVVSGDRRGGRRQRSRMPRLPESLMSGARVLLL
ncbi:MAG: hypothetical protein ACLR0U_20555 [Enterocloster clostridioformis]